MQNGQSHPGSAHFPENHTSKSDNILFKEPISSADSAIPLPIRIWSGAQERSSYLASPPFQETRLTSLVQPFLALEITPMCSFT